MERRAAEEKMRAEENEEVTRVKEVFWRSNPLVLWVEWFSSRRLMESREAKKEMKERQSQEE